MVYLAFFQHMPLPNNIMQGFYNNKLVLLSYIVAVLASYVALEITQTIRQEKQSIFWWLLSGAFAMGGGIFTMHFIGMLAFKMEMPSDYDFYWTMISLIVAIVASGFAFYLIKDPQIRVSQPRFFWGGVVLGLAIAGMHYTGMTAMNGVKITYLPGLFFLSIFVAIMASLVALYLMLECEKGSVFRQRILKSVSVLVMGAAISGMHYIGMAAAIIVPDEVHFIPVLISFTLSPERLSFVVAFVASLLMVVSLLATGYKHLVIVKMLIGFLITPLLLVPLTVVFFQNIHKTQQWSQIIANELFPTLQALFELDRINLRMEQANSTNDLRSYKKALMESLGEIDKWSKIYVEKQSQKRQYFPDFYNFNELKDNMHLSAITLSELIEKGASYEEIESQKKILNNENVELSALIKKIINDELLVFEKWKSESSSYEKESIEIFLFILGSIILFSIVMSVFMTFQIIRPVIKMKEISKEIAEGDLNKKVPIMSNDEIGQLGKNFNEMVDALAISNRKKDVLLRAVAHDLRNPLSVIIESNNLLSVDLVDKVNSENRQLFEIVKRGGDSMLSLLNSLLQINTLNSGIFKIELMKVVIKNFFQGIFEFNELIAKRKRIKFNMTMDVKDKFIYFDPAKIDQVVNNLLSNAFKFSPPGSKVLLVINEDGEKMRVEVHDDGPGIPLGEQNKIFVPFAKISVKPTGLESSNGLGLALCKDIIEAHKGIIGFKSVVGKGSIFYFEINITNNFDTLKNENKQPEITKPIDSSRKTSPINDSNISDDDVIY